MPIDLATYRRQFAGLLFEEPEPTILELILSNPRKRNALDERMHSDLARIWRTIDADETIRAVLVSWRKRALNNWLRVAGPAFDASLALEFLGFRLSDARKGVEALMKKQEVPRGK